MNPETEYSKREIDYSRMARRQRTVIRVARTVSMVFTPFYLPLLGFILLFFVSSLSLMNGFFKFFTLAMVYLFTVLFPTLLIHGYRRHQGWTKIELGVKERRIVPYIVSIACYFLCLYLMRFLRFPHLMEVILVAALVIQLVCAFVNVWWKVSTHTAAIGGVAGAVCAYAVLFGFNPMGWLCLTILVAGVVGTSRMILRQHSLSQVVAGFFLGWLLGTWSILYF